MLSVYIPFFVTGYLTFCPLDPIFIYSFELWNVRSLIKLHWKFTLSARTLKLQSRAGKKCGCYALTYRYSFIWSRYIRFFQQSFLLREYSTKVVWTLSDFLPSLHIGKNIFWNTGKFHHQRKKLLHIKSAKRSSSKIAHLVNYNKFLGFYRENVTMRNCE